MSHGKNYRNSAKKIKKDAYSVSEAAVLVKETSHVKFDATVEVHVNLELDPKQADQQLRTTVSLPHGTGKTKKVVAFVPDDKVKEAKDAGAIEAGSAALIEKVKGGWTEFDVAVAHPSLMPEIAKLGKVLGTKGLMPNPKAGTVGPDVAKMVKELMGGRIEIKLDPTGIVHTVAGKVSFDASKLEENIRAILDTIKANKPSGVKDVYVLSIAVNSSMGPNIPISMSEIR